MDNIPAKQIDGKFVVVSETKSVVEQDFIFDRNQIQHFDQLIMVSNLCLYELYVQWHLWNAYYMLKQIQFREMEIKCTCFNGSYKYTTLGGIIVTQWYLR
jgi:hypothetical protein